MGFMQIAVILMTITVARSAGEYRACNSSSIFHNGTSRSSWTINGYGCENNVTMVVVHIQKISVWAWNCRATVTVAGINLCNKRKGTCIVSTSQDHYFKAETLKDCQSTVFAIRNHALPVVITYSFGQWWTSFDLNYTVYETVDKKEQDQTATIPFMTVPHKETSQAPQTSQVAAPLLGIVFGILFGIASVSFVVLLYKFLQQKKELKEFQASAVSPRNNATHVDNEANVDAEYSQVNNNRGPNNTSEAEVAVNALYHM